MEVRAAVALPQDGGAPGGHVGGAGHPVEGGAPGEGQAVEADRALAIVVLQ